MSDYEFEKKVQEELNQLYISPSNAVWPRLETRIRRARRRRRILIWLPLFLLLGLGSYWILHDGKPGDTLSITKNERNMAQPDSGQYKPPPEKPKPGHFNSHIPEPANNKKQFSASRSDSSVQRHNDSLEKDPNVIVNIPENHSDEKITSEKPKDEKIKKQPIAWNARVVNKRVERKSLVRNKVNGKTGLSGEPNESVQISSINDETGTSNRINSSFLFPRHASRPEFIKPEILTSFPATSSMPEVLKDNLMAGLQKKDSGKQSKALGWQWGISVAFGQSGINSGGFFDIFGKSAAADLSAGAGTSSGIPIAPPSQLQKKTSYGLGLFFRRRINNRLSLGSGLEYRYASTRIETGSKIDSSRSIINGPSAGLQVPGFYNSGNLGSYTNRYHFVEIPITLLTQLNPKGKPVISLDLGLSISLLAANRALHYEGSSGIYYRDPSLFRKIQWGMHTGISVTLFPRSAHPLEIGPAIHYNFSPMLKNGTGSRNYLYYYGLNAHWILKK